MARNRDCLLPCLEKDQTARCDPGISCCRLLGPAVLVVYPALCAGQLCPDQCGYLGGIVTLLAGIIGDTVMVNRFKRLTYRLPGWLLDALTGFFYASLIILILLLSGTGDSSFRYLDL